MELFKYDATQNLLPYEGVVNYYGRILNQAQADYFLHELLHHITWKNDEAVIFGRHIITRRKVAWYGDKEFSYTYSNITRQALAWTGDLKKLKTIVEELTGTVFNSCLLNLYHNGDESMAWHSDDEKSLGKDSAIASFSFGEERRFSFRHKKSKETISLLLEHGSLLVMKGSTQTNWLHSLPKSKKITGPRINLTFRTMLVRE